MVSEQCVVWICSVLLTCSQPFLLLFYSCTWKPYHHVLKPNFLTPLHLFLSRTWRLKGLCLKWNPDTFPPVVNHPNTLILKWNGLLRLNNFFLTHQIPGQKQHLDSANGVILPLDFYQIPTHFPFACCSMPETDRAAGWAAGSKATIVKEMWNTWIHSSSSNLLQVPPNEVESSMKLCRPIDHI